MSNKKSWIKNEVILSIIIPVIFLVIGFFVRMYFAENAYPIDYEVIDSYDWANMFLGLFILSTILCIIYNIAIAVIGEKFDIHSQKAWLIYGIFSIVISLIGPIYMCFGYREESACTIIMFAMFILQHVVTFLISTYNCPRHWDFCPFKFR